jgi:hypothetical protein
LLTNAILHSMPPERSGVASALAVISFAALRQNPRPVNAADEALIPAMAAELAGEFSRALGRAVSYLDVPLDRWQAEGLSRMGLPPHVEQHIATMAQLHRHNRYDRTADGVERVTGIPP